MLYLSSMEWSIFLLLLLSPFCFTLSIDNNIIPLPYNASEPRCGSWCRGVDNATASCNVDEHLVACRGKYCTVTCALWHLNVLSAPQPVIPCGVYQASQAFPLDSSPCKKGCLPYEASLQEDPHPLGLGLQCCHDTCLPASQHHYTQGSSNPRCGILQCPCNAYGSDCPEGLVTPICIVKTSMTEPSHVVKLAFSFATLAWQSIMKYYTPGATIRVLWKEKGWGEGIYRVGNIDVNKTTIEVWTEPPPSHMLPEAVVVPTALRNDISEGHSTPPGILISPVLDTFTSIMKTRALSTFASTNSTLLETKRMIFVTTGVGIAAIQGTIDYFTQYCPTTWKSILHNGVVLYDGNSLYTQVPNMEAAVQWQNDKEVNTTIVLSNPPPHTCNPNDEICKNARDGYARWPQLLINNTIVQKYVNASSSSPPRTSQLRETTNKNFYIKRRAARYTNDEDSQKNADVEGMEMKGLRDIVSDDNNDEHTESSPSPPKIYAQHAMALDLTSANGALAQAGYTFDNSIIIGVGRYEMVKQLFPLLLDLCQASSHSNATCTAVGDADPVAQDYLWYK